jgi:hypothetical protein
MPSRLEPQSWEVEGYPYLVAGDGSTIPTGTDGAFYVREARTIRWWELAGPSDQTGSISLSLRAATYGTYPAVSEILAPHIAGGVKNSSREAPTLGNVSVPIPGDTWVEVVVVSSSGFTKWVALTLGLENHP